MKIINTMGKGFIYDFIPHNPEQSTAIMWKARTEY